MRWVSSIFSPGVGQEAWQGMDWASAQPQGEEQTEVGVQGEGVPLGVWEGVKCQVHKIKQS